jgi:hypothetical protein
VYALEGLLNRAKWLTFGGSPQSDPAAEQDAEVYSNGGSRGISHFPKTGDASVNSA